MGAFVLFPPAHRPPGQLEAQLVVAQRIGNGGAQVLDQRLQPQEAQHPCTRLRAKGCAGRRTRQGTHAEAEEPDQGPRRAAQQNRRAPDQRNVLAGRKQDLADDGKVDARQAFDEKAVRERPLLGQRAADAQHAVHARPPVIKPVRAVVGIVRGRRGGWAACCHS